MLKRPILAANYYLKPNLVNALSNCICLYCIAADRAASLEPKAENLNCFLTGVNPKDLGNLKSLVS